jgi:hypothetical protein
MTLKLEDAAGIQAVSVVLENSFGEGISGDTIFDPNSIAVNYSF